MKVYLRPIGLHSRAMLRVMEALAAAAPAGVVIVEDLAAADLHVVHVTDETSLAGADLSRPYVFIQYCLNSMATDTPLQTVWFPRWSAARLVWSYYDLTEFDCQMNFYHAPLGVDAIFTQDVPDVHRHIGVMTSGYVSHPKAEAIEEVVNAARRCGMGHKHLGPPDVAGMTQRLATAEHAIPDERLVWLYHRTQWVSGLRHGEGFELPVIEGLACGACPIVFDRPDMRQWYEGLAVFIPECHGQELEDRLVTLFHEYEPEPITEAQRRRVLSRFNWATIAGEFWTRVLMATVLPESNIRMELV